MLTAIYEEARFWFSTLAFRCRKRSMFFGFRRSVFNVENEFWFSKSFSSPIGRRTLCRKAKTLFGFWFSTLRPKCNIMNVQPGPPKNPKIVRFPFPRYSPSVKELQKIRQNRFCRVSERGSRYFDCNTCRYRRNYISFERVLTLSQIFWSYHEFSFPLSVTR